MSDPRQLAEALRRVMSGWEGLGDDLQRLRRARRSAGPVVPPAMPTVLDAEPETLLAVPPIPDVPLFPVPNETPAAPAPRLAVGVPVLAVPVPQHSGPTAEMDRLLALANELPDPTPRASAPVEEAVDRLDMDADLLPSLMGETQDLNEAIAQGLEQWSAGDARVIAPLRRDIHTLKGLMRMAGAMATGLLLHDMETVMEDIEEGRRDGAAERPRLVEQFEAVRVGLAALFDAGVAPVAPSSDDEAFAPAAPAVTPLPTPRQVRVDAELIDRLSVETNEARLTAAALEGAVRDQRLGLRDLGDNGHGLGRLLRELDMYAESQIQSRRAQLAPGEEFDPLELDNYTFLQELSRSLNEMAADAVDLQRDMGRRLADQETLLTYQSRAINEVQTGLHQTRLTPVDGLVQDRLLRVTWKTAHELGKPVRFTLDSGRLELDRVLLERVIPPLEHILRNAVDHGLESETERQAAGKPAEGHIHVRVRQQAGRVSLQVSDDGAGLRVEKIRGKAIEKGLWEPTRPMSDQEAADMVCQPGFSTASAVSQISGRGVGMDVVRSSVLAMGGRFDIRSRPGQGMSVTIQLPTVVATASVLLVQAGGESWALPVDLVEDVERHAHAVLDAAEQAGEWITPDGPVPCVDLAALMGLRPSPHAGLARPVVWVREGTRRMAVLVESLGQVVEVPLRPAGPLWAHVEGVAGATVLPDGQAAFLVDPLRAPGVRERNAPARPAHRNPVVLVVDDSITVRKATVRFLERQGYEVLTAKDGQEALEVLALGAAPAMILMDVEMPRMNGFECVQALRQNPRYTAIPIVMITSRTADKHRRRAEELGVQGYLGKPFKEDELTVLLQDWAPLGPR